MAKRATQSTDARIVAVLTSTPQRVPDIAQLAGVSMADVFRLAANDPEGRLKVVDLQTRPGYGQLTAIALA